MLISLDYDDTYTLDPEFWMKFIDLAESHGHKVVCATMRTVAEGNLMDEKFTKRLTVFFTAREAKQTFLNKLGLFPSVWIDDTPLFINFAASR